MLSDERIKQLALDSVTHPNAFVQTRLESVERAIRLAVAETVAACAKESIAYAKTCRQTIKNTEGLGMRLRLDDMAAAAEQVAAAIREKAREKK